MRNSIVTYKSPKDPISEAFRNMRTNITFSDIDNEIKVLTMIIGPMSIKSTA